MEVSASTASVHEGIQDGLEKLHALVKIFKELITGASGKGASRDIPLSSTYLETSAALRVSLEAVFLERDKISGTSEGHIQSSTENSVLEARRDSLKTQIEAHNELQKHLMDSCRSLLDSMVMWETTRKQLEMRNQAALQ
eukprot:gene5598-2622_t